MIICHCLNIFSVTRVTDLTNTAGNLAALTPTCIPEHSLIAYIDLSRLDNVTDCFLYNDCFDTSKTFVKFNVDIIPPSVMSGADTLLQINAFIDNLEQSKKNDDINHVYSQFCKSLKPNMYENVPYKSFTVSSSNKKPRVSKPWWSDYLTVLWSDICNAECKVGGL
ncbi:hypothetical protein ACF0H5_000840 [Mactra antiquata]